MQGQPSSPMRLLEMLSDRFGAFEAIANSTIKLARFVPEDELSMDLLVAELPVDVSNVLVAVCAECGGTVAVPYQSSAELNAARSTARDL